MLGSGSPPPRVHLLVGLMCGVSFSVITLIGLAVPLVPRALEELSPGTEVELANAVIMASFPLSILLATPFAARVSHAYGRFALLEGGLVILFSAAVVFAFGPGLGGGHLTTTATILLVSRAVQGVGAAASNQAIFAIIADAIPDSLGTAMGANEVAIGLASTTAPVAGSVLYAASGFRLPLLLGAGLVGAMLPLAACAAAGHAPHGGGKPAAGSENDQVMSEKSQPPLPSILTPRLLFAAGGEALAMLVFGVLNGILMIHLDGEGVSPSRGGITYGLMSLTYAVTAPLAGVAADRWAGLRPSVDQGQYQDVMAVGLVISGVASVALYFAQGVGAAGEEARWHVELAALGLMGVGQAAALIPTLPAVKVGIPAEAAVDDATAALATDKACTLYNVAMQSGCTACPPPARRPGRLTPPRPSPRRCSPAASHLGPCSARCWRVRWGLSGRWLLWASCASSTAAWASPSACMPAPGSRRRHGSACERASARA